MKTFLRNLKFLFETDLRRWQWHRISIEKAIRNAGTLALRSGPYGSGVPLPEAHAPVNSHEFGVFSQNGEDGMLLWIFSIIGTRTKTLIEFGMGHGRECIGTNLLLNFGWSGLLMDGSAQNIAEAAEYFRSVLTSADRSRVELTQAFITRENINDILKTRQHGGEPDLLVIDIDGNDYWVWEAIQVVKPRVVVIEYNSTFGPESSVTIPYKADFDTYKEHGEGLYHGASIVALAKLGEKKGYVLVGCDSNGCNAFFVRKDVTGALVAVAPHKAFYENTHKVKRGSREVQFAKISGKPLVEI